MFALEAPSSDGQHAQAIARKGRNAIKHLTAALRVHPTQPRDRFGRSLHGYLKSRIILRFPNVRDGKQITRQVVFTLERHHVECRHLVLR